MMMLTLEGWPCAGFSIRVQLAEDKPLGKVLGAMASRLRKSDHDVEAVDLEVHDGRGQVLSRSASSLEAFRSAGGHLLVRASVSLAVDRLVARASSTTDALLAAAKAAEVLLVAGEGSRAAAIAEKALESCRRKSSVAVPKEDALVVVQRLLFCAAAGLKGDSDKSLRYYEMARHLATAKSPSYKVISHNLVVLLASTGRVKAASEISKETAEACDSAELWYEHGCLAAATGDRDSALEAYRRALDADKTHAASYVNYVQTTLSVDVAAKIAKEAIENNVIWRFPLQRPPHWYPDLEEQKPWHDAKDVWFCERVLERHHLIIKDEFLRDKEYMKDVGQRQGFAHDGSLTVKGTWREAVFFAGHSREIAEETRIRFPKTAAILSTITEALSCAELGCGEVLFSTLTPGTVLRPHCGGTNARLTCHLGVVVPENQDITITCGGQRATWKEGRCLVFDDSFQHEVHHRGHDDRTVLLLNFWHPGFKHRHANWRAHARHADILDQYNTTC